MKTVFIVDDSNAIRERLLSLVRDVPGVTIAGETGDPLLALQAIHDRCPDVVIVDIRMPRMSGIQMLDAIRKGACAPMTIILTHNASEPYRRRCLEAGADIFLDKATEFEKISEILKDAAQA